MIERMAGTKDFRVDLTAGHGLEGDGADELARRAGHHHVHLCTGLCKQTRQPH
jgi:hypothetical protein